MPWWMIKLLMAPEGDATGGGGAGGAPTAPPSASGGDPLDLLGNGAPPTVPPGTPPGSPPPPPAPTAGDWTKDFPDDIKKAAFMAKYKNPAELAKGYAHLEKMLGHDKIPVPAKGTPLAGLRDVFQRIGLPEKVEDYKIEFTDKEVNPKFAENFKKTAFEMGLLPEQAKGIADALLANSKASQEADREAAKQSVIDRITRFKTEQGSAFDQTIAQAKAGLKDLASAEDAEYFRSIGLGTDPKFIQMMAKYAKANLSEGQIKGEGGTQPGALSPADAREKIKSLSPSDPYYDKTHAQHAARKAEVKGWYEYAFPGTGPRDATPKN